MASPSGTAGTHFSVGLIEARDRLRRCGRLGSRGILDVHGGGMLSLRTATDADLVLVAQMNARLIADEGSRNPMGLTELEQRARGWLNDGSWSLDFIERDGTVAGYAVYQRRRDEYDSEKCVVYIRQFFIEREERGRGTGTEALALLVATRFPPRCSLTIDVLASNPAAERFWSRVGFRPYAKTMVLPPKG